MLNTRYGITPAQPIGSTAPRTPKPCGRCQTVNRADARFCIRYGGPFDAAAILELKTRDEEARRLWWAAFSSDPDSTDVKTQTDAITSRIVEELARTGTLQRAIQQQLASRGPKPMPRSDREHSA